ncbi:MAG: sigma-70 family RNA polymerase sigma factor [Polyangiaceae bacterium]|nr:sigma-70 family RNA polymerase sigma factor [Polyangiaceae bacterium]
MNAPRSAAQVVGPVSEAGEVVHVELDSAAVFRRYAPYVAAVAQRLLGRDQEVDDTVQDVFLVALRSLPQLRDPDALRGWLARIAVRVASRRLRTRRLRAFLRLDQTPHDALPIDRNASPEQRVLLASLYRALDELPTSQRVAWILRHVEGEPLAEVAALMGCSLATAKRRIATAEEWLEGVLSDV